MLSTRAQVLPWSPNVLQQVFSESVVHAVPYKLLRKDSLWRWGEQQQKEFEESKLLTSSKFLAHFDSFRVMCQHMVWVPFCHTGCQTDLRNR